MTISSGSSMPLACWSADDRRPELLGDRGQRVALGDRVGLLRRRRDDRRRGRRRSRRRRDGRRHGRRARGRRRRRAGGRRRRAGSASGSARRSASRSHAASRPGLVEQRAGDGGAGQAEGGDPGADDDPRRRARGPRPAGHAAPRRLRGEEEAGGDEAVADARPCRASRHRCGTRTPGSARSGRAHRSGRAGPACVRSSGVGGSSAKQRCAASTPSIVTPRSPASPRSGQTRSTGPSITRPPPSRTVRATRLKVKYPGDDLFSQEVAPRVSSALESLTSVFGMGTGGASPLASPG